MVDARRPRLDAAQDRLVVEDVADEERDHLVRYGTLPQKPLRLVCLS